MDTVTVILLVIGLLAIIAAICLYNKNINLVKEWAYEFIVHAEQTIMGTAMGRERMMYVIARIRELLPWYLKAIFTEMILQEIIQHCFDIIKSAFEHGIVKEEK